MADNNTDYSVPGLKVCKLVMVTAENNNKYYNMFEQSDGSYKVVYGRIQSSGIELSNPMNQWDSTVKSKVKKGYSDMTHLRREVLAEAEVKVSGTQKVKQIDIVDTAVRDLINKLQAFANKSVQQNYTISAAAVTQAMVDEAQSTLNEVNACLSLNGDVKKVNNLLLKLYTIIPRRMSQVKYHLVQSLSGREYQDAQKLVAKEQQELDVMAGQVAMELQQKKAATPLTGEEVKKQATLLDTLGLEVVPVSNKEAEMIRTMMGPNSNQYRKAFKVVNKKTETLYQTNLKNAKNKKTELFWHGSRNENWFSILQSGLLIRPSGAVHSGSMFGDGIYGANKAQKSIGYTSSRGSYWANGSADVAYLALFEFHVGNQKHITRHDSSCYNLCKSKLRSEDCDSVYAHGGIDLRNDEFIVYDAAQVTVKYIIEFS